jgi:ABC-type amino acid transport substrate-binding protein
MHMKIRRIGIVLVAVGLLASACATDDGDGDGQAQEFEEGSFMAELAEEGTITVGVKFDVPQFGFRNPTTDEVEGFDADMGREIAEALGVEARFVEAISRNRIPFLLEDQVDIIFSTMTVTDERKEQIDFSEVYYVAAQSFLTKKGEGLTVETAADKRVCTAKGSTSELNLPAVQPDVEVVLQDGYAQCVQLLRNDQVDAVSTDDVILLQFLKQDPDAFEVSEDTFSQEPYGAGIKKGHDEFVEFVNGVIGDMKEDGRWADLYEKWVTPVTNEDPPDPPAADVEFEVEGLDAPVTPVPTTPAAASPTP